MATATKTTGTATTTPARGVTDGSAARPAASRNAAPARKLLSMGDLGHKLDGISILDQDGLNEYLETVRALQHCLAMNIALQAGQVKSGMEAAARADSRFHALGIDARRSIRAVCRKMDAAADHCASAAGDAISAWMTFEKEFEHILSKLPAKAKPKGFSITI